MDTKNRVITHEITDAEMREIRATETSTESLMRLFRDHANYAEQIEVTSNKDGTFKMRPIKEVRDKAKRLDEVIHKCEWKIRNQETCSPSYSEGQQDFAEAILKIAKG